MTILKIHVCIFYQKCAYKTVKGVQALHYNNVLPHIKHTLHTYSIKTHKYF